jgi:pimeloyl-ACP methyl ester carboxylesterase
LHGGPGITQMGYIRHFTNPLENAFTVVNYDQRGAGKSYSSNIDKRTMTVEQLLNDMLEISNYLLKRFNKQKLFLCGHSWGSALGLLAVKKNPELFTAYIGISQIVNMTKGEELSYQYTVTKANEANHQNAITELTSIGKPPYKSLKDNLKQRKWLDFFGGSTHSIKMNALMQKASSLKEYNLWDWIWRFRKGTYFSLESLMQELLAIQFDKTIDEVNIPIYFFEGTSDYQVPFELAKTYFDTLKASDKTLLLFENCGHMIPFEQPEKFCTELLKIKSQHHK